MEGNTMSVEENLIKQMVLLKKDVGKVTDDKKPKKKELLKKEFQKLKKLPKMPKMLLKEQLKVLKILLKRTINNSKIG